MNPLSVIIHCDLDCFYAQVERERLQLPPDAAVVVVQWSSALAVSYPARKYGIKRQSTVDDIRRLAPSEDAVTIVHVETISNDTVDGGKSSGYSPLNERQRMEKVSLERYRRASARVFSALRKEMTKMHPSTILERASIDEAYIDVSLEVNRRIQSSSNPLALPPYSTDTHIVGSETARTDNNNDVETPSVEHSSNSVAHSDCDLRLAHGAAIASQLRQAVFKESSYTMSAGISVNKLLSKFASASYKPNQQTIVPISAISSLLYSTPVTRLRGLGGKIGQHLNNNLKICTAGDALAYSQRQLTDALCGDAKAAHLVWRSVRGMDDAAVSARDAPKSLLAAKSFSTEKSLTGTVEKTWVPLLSSELAKRIAEEEELTKRTARTLSVSFRGTRDGSPPFIAGSRSVSMPVGGKLSEEISRLAFEVLKKVFEGDDSGTGRKGGDKFVLPINFLGLTACNFSEAVDERQQISHFFGSNVNSNQGEEGENTVQVESNKTEAEVKKEHEQRLQEKADRELARRLHREESMKGVQKSTSRSRKRVKSTGSNGVKTLDQFFRPK